MVKIFSDLQKLRFLKIFMGASQKYVQTLHLSQLSQNRCSGNESFAKLLRKEESGTVCYEMKEKTMVRIDNGMPKHLN